jgi:hypothetical protein
MMYLLSILLGVVAVISATFILVIILDSLKLFFNFYKDDKLLIILAIIAHLILTICLLLIYIIIH